MAKRDGLSDLVRVLDNMYTRIFEQSVPKQNRLLSDVLVVREEAPAQTEELNEFGDSVSVDTPVTARVYGDLVLVDQHYEYTRFVLDPREGSIVIRFSPTFNAADQSGINYLMSWVRES